MGRIGTLVRALLPALLLLSVPLAACRGPSLADTLPGRATATPAEERPATGFRDLLSKYGGESRNPLGIDTDSAMKTILEEQARHGTTGRSGFEMSDCSGRDELDLYQCLYGVSGRQAARFVREQAERARTKDKK